MIRSTITINFDPDDLQRLRPVVVFDLLINNAMQGQPYPVRSAKPPMAGSTMVYVSMSMKSCAP